MKKEIELINDQIHLPTILNWYHRERTKTDAKKFLIEYAEKYNQKFLKLVKEKNDTSIVPTYGWLSRIYIRGYQENYIKSRIDEYLRSLEFFNDIEQPTLRHYSKRTEFDINGFLEHMDNVVDTFFLHKKEFDINKEIKRNSVPKKYFSEISEWANGILDDVFYDLESEERGYQITDSQFKKLKNCLTIDENTIKERKTRKRKINPEKILSKFKYLKNYGRYESVSPLTLIGSKFAVTYNTKYKIVSLFKSSSIDGLEIKGSSIYNFSGEFGRKRLRKPDEFLEKVNNGDKEQIINEYDNLKTMKLKSSGQMNDQSIILKVFK